MSRITCQLNTCNKPAAIYNAHNETGPPTPVRLCKTHARGWAKLAGVPTEHIDNVLDSVRPSDPRATTPVS